MHLPPGVRLLMYHRAKAAMDLQHRPNTYAGEAPHEDVCVMSRSYDQRYGTRVAYLTSAASMVCACQLTRSSRDCTTRNLCAGWALR